MPRIRTLKPEFFRSPSTAKVDPLVRIFYQALWCWADDFGVGETNLYGWLGFAFPDDQEVYDPELRGFRAVSAQDLRRFCADCAQHYETAFYIVRERHYYCIKSWDEHQKTERRNNRRKYPGPDDPDAVPDLQFRFGAESAPILRRQTGADSRIIRAGTGEQGNRGTGEEGTGEEEQLTQDRTKRSVSNAREKNGDQINDSMGRQEMSLTKMMGSQVAPFEPPPPDRGGTVGADARELVQAVIPKAILSSTKVAWGIKMQVSTLLNHGAELVDVEETLKRWLKREGAYPGDIPHIYADVVKEKYGPLEPRQGAGPRRGTDQKIAGWQSLKRVESGNLELE